MDAIYVAFIVMFFSSWYQTLVFLVLVVLLVVWPYKAPWQKGSMRTGWSKEWNECKDSFNLKHTALFKTGHRVSFHPLIFCRGLQRLDFYLSERRPDLVPEWTTVLFRCSQGGLWGRSVRKVISQSPECFTDTLAHQRHDTGLHQCRGCRKNIYIYLDRKWGGRQTKALSVLAFIRKGWVTYMATNSTNVRFYDRAAQTKRVSMHRISDKRRLEMLAVGPLIRRSNIWNQSVCLKKGRLHSSQRKLKVGNCWLDGRAKRNQHPFPQHDQSEPRKVQPRSHLKVNTPSHAAAVRKHRGVDRKRGAILASAGISICSLPLKLAADKHAG